MLPLNDEQPHEASGTSIRNCAPAANELVFTSQCDEGRPIDIPSNRYVVQSWVPALGRCPFTQKTGLLSGHNVNRKAAWKFLVHVSNWADCLSGPVA
jgi:hypothetical protein